MFRKPKEVEPQTEKKESSQFDLSIGELVELYEKGILGIIEFRNILSYRYRPFSISRDEDIDYEISELAKQRIERIRSHIEENTSSS